ncbi:hypothetical protein RJ55_04391 [Drechmeria coniospora]|nr:hypothetical protein RJ55_04391 [Drechmeria coniospora]
MCGRSQSTHEAAREPAACRTQAPGSHRLPSRVGRAAQASCDFGICRTRRSVLDSGAAPRATRGHGHAGGERPTHGPRGRTGAPFVAEQRIQRTTVKGQTVTRIEEGRREIPSGRASDGASSRSRLPAVDRSRRILSVRSIMIVLGPFCVWPLAFSVSTGFRVLAALNAMPAAPAASLPDWLTCNTGASKYIIGTLPLILRQLAVTISGSEPPASVQRTTNVNHKDRPESALRVSSACPSLVARASRRPTWPFICGPNLDGVEVNSTKRGGEDAKVQRLYEGFRA